MQNETEDLKTEPVVRSEHIKLKDCFFLKIDKDKQAFEGEKKLIVFSNVLYAVGLGSVASGLTWIAIDGDSRLAGHLLETGVLSQFAGVAVRVAHLAMRIATRSGLKTDAREKKTE